MIYFSLLTINFFRSIKNKNLHFISLLAQLKYSMKNTNIVVSDMRLSFPDTVILSLFHVYLTPDSQFFHKNN